MLLSLSDISKSFGERDIVKSATFSIYENEKVALIGANGTGKTTLFKIINKELAPDSGEVIISKTATIGYVEQTPCLNSNKTIYDEFLSARQDLIDMSARINELSALMHSEKDKTKLDSYIKEFTALNAQFEALDGWAYKSKANGILKGLGFDESTFNKSVENLSGGEKTRLELAKVLFREPDLMLLDEPTNHLDTDAISWLETYLGTYKKALIVISHDRYFLDKVVNKVMLLENSRLKIYNGNYTAFYEKYDKEKEAYIKAYENQQREIQHQQDVITQLKRFNREKSIRAAESREKKLEKMDVLDKPVTEEDFMKLRFHTNVLGGKDVLDVKDLSKSFDSQLLFKGISFDIKRGERVALIGGNGTGKTTILKMINDELLPDEGSIKKGANVEIKYFDQQHQVLNEKNSIFDEISDTYPDMDNTAIRNTLAAFMFTGDDVFKQISMLSGGEKGRVALAKLMLSNANFLILDEPTNHLDINSKEILEKALLEYEGSVLFVSHDRYFINRTATRIIELKDEKLNFYLGNYDYYLMKREEKKALETDTKEETKITDNQRNWQETKRIQAEMKKLKNRFQEIEKLITSHEEEIEKIDAELVLPENATDPAKCLELSRNKEKLETSLEELFTEWADIEDKLQNYE